MDKTISTGVLSMFESLFIVAEAGSNHNGDLDTAIKMVRRAKESGADAIKFQNYTLSSLFSPGHYEGTLKLRDKKWRKRIEHLSVKQEWHRALASTAQEAGIHYFSTPFSLEAVDSLDDFVPFYKIASGDITFLPLLEKVGRKGKGVFLSTGASSLDEIETAVRLLEHFDLPFICIMHCIMLYPPPDEGLHLNFIDTLKERFKHPIGFSDHTLDSDAATIAAGKGVSAIEKHFTLDCTQDGADHRNSLDPEGFRKMAERIRRCEIMLGSPERPIGEIEARERVFARRGVYTKENLKRGERVSPRLVSYLRPKLGIGAEEFGSLKNRRLNTDVSKGTPLEQGMFE